MKILITTSLLLATISATSQTWCDPGADWKYNYSNGFGTEGYTQMTYVGDTLILGQAAQKIDKHIYAYDYNSAQNIEYDLGQEYTYEENGIVYLRYNNNWDTLYNFNASIGDTWKMAGQPTLNACDSSSTLTVTAIGSTIINSVLLNYLVVDFSFPWEYSDTIIEKIGFTGSYMLPYDLCNGALDGNEGGPFRCYQDDNFASYQPHYTGHCDFIVGVTESTQQTQMRIVPNPATDQIEITGLTNFNFEYTLTNTLGEEWNIQPSGTTFNIIDFPNGFYMLTVQNEQAMQRIKFIKH